MNNRLIRTKGSFLAEFVVCVPLFLLVIASLLGFMKAAAIRRQLLEIARLGADLQSCGRVSLDVIDGILEEERMALLNRGLDVKFERGRFLGTSSARFYNFFFVQAKAKFSPPVLKRMDFQGFEFDEIVVMERG